ncbi:MAG TPA: hypothetical protein VK081_01980 [Planctomycetota bacterium]|nr:hypothetical protein [Planctomycetota bacterium]
MSAAAEILGFVRRVRRRALLAAAVPAAVGGAVLVGASWLVARKAAPEWAGAIAALALAVAVACVAAAAAGARPTVRAVGELAGAGDALLTWWPYRRGATAGMAAWLEARLAERVGALAPALVARPAVRRARRRLLYLLPLLLLVLLLALVLPGGLGSGDRAGLGGAPAQGEGDAAQAGDEGEPAPRRERDGGEPDGGGGAPQLEPQREPEAGTAVPARPPLDLPVREEFVVPQFLGEGPSAPAKAHQAEVEVGGAGRAPSRAAPSVAPSPGPEEFERARERALHSRHVPPAERGIVQRYFEALAERR